MRYRMATTEDTWEIHQLLRSNNLPEQETAFPTVLALNDDKIVGMMATTPNDEMVLAGPLVLEHDKRRPFTAIRLIELYDAAMLHLGIVSYIFYTAIDSPLRPYVKRLWPDMHPYASDGQHEFYSRKLQ